MYGLMGPTEVPCSKGWHIGGRSKIAHTDLLRSKVEDVLTMQTIPWTRSDKGITDSRQETMLRNGTSTVTLVQPVVRALSISTMLRPCSRG
jgi:hypothetical protein